MIRRPDSTEFAEYYSTYVNKVPDGDIREILDAQSVEVPALLDAIPEARADYRYAADKWSIREVLAHINDCERMFTFRALWFARGFNSPMPSFDQNVAMTGANANARAWASHIAEFRAVRAATLALFAGLSPEAWDCRGIASDNPVTVRALAYITAGHLAHHVALLNERYLSRASAR